MTLLGEERQYVPRIAVRSARAIIYRYLSNADFFNIYKPTGTEPGGGGQTYIDFLTRFIPIDDWRRFFHDVPGVVETAGAQGPRWRFDINSIGVPPRKRQQQLAIYQRRSASVCISSQNLHGRGANRVEAWKPEYGFPEPADPNNRRELPPGLAIYLIRSHEKDIWAGWFQEPAIYRDARAGDFLRPILADNEPGAVGILRFRETQLNFDEADPRRPFFTGAGAGGEISTALASPTAARTTPSEEQLLSTLFQEDVGTRGASDPSLREYVVAVRRRNTAAVRGLKLLYKDECQATGTKWIFKKRDGRNYTEAHHLVSLGEGGADDPRNIVVVSPLFHRMLHHADVGPIDLSKIETQKDGTGILQITINGKNYSIMWHPEHARAVLNQSR